MKLHMKIKNAPEGVHPDQLFESEEHLTEILDAWTASGKMEKVKRTKEGITFETKQPTFTDTKKGSATITEQPDDFTNIVKEVDPEAPIEEDPE